MKICISIYIWKLYEYFEQAWNRGNQENKEDHCAPLKEATWTEENPEPLKRWIGGDEIKNYQGRNFTKTESWVDFYL